MRNLRGILTLFTLITVMSGTASALTPAEQALAKDKSSIFGSGQGYDNSMSFSFQNLMSKDPDLKDKEAEKRRSMKVKTESCQDMVKSAESLAAKKAAEQIVERVVSKCLSKLGSIKFDIKIPSLFDMLLNAAKKRIFAEIDKACAQMNNAIGSTTDFKIGGKIMGQDIGVGGGAVTGNGSGNGYVPTVDKTPVWQNNSGGSSNAGNNKVPGVKF